MDFFSVPEVAKKLGVTREALSAKCKKLGFPKVGNQYILGEKEIQILIETHKKAGRPKKDISDK